MFYEARTVLVTHPNESYDDGIRRLFFYTEGEPQDPNSEHGKKVKNLLNYIRHSKQQNVVDDTIREIDRIVHAVKIREEVSIAYMQSWEKEYFIRKEEREKFQEEIDLLKQTIADQDRLIFELREQLAAAKK